VRVSGTFRKNEGRSKSRILMLIVTLCAGSPFKPYIVDPGRVRVTGGWSAQVNDKGLIPLHVNKEKLLPFDASDAGLGKHCSHR